MCYKTSFTRFISLELDKNCVNCTYITFPREEVFFPDTSQPPSKKNNLTAFILQFRRFVVFGVRKHADFLTMFTNHILPGQSTSAREH